MTAQDRDKLRIYNLLKYRPGEAHTITEMGTITGLGDQRVREAVAALLSLGRLTAADGFFWVEKVR
jgi:hypothetical protein